MERSLVACKMYFVKFAIGAFDIEIPVMYVMKYLTCLPEGKIFPKF